MPSSEPWPSWQTAWRQALYGPTGFYRRPEGPAGHFRTAAHAAGPELARALRRLAQELGCRTIVDVGAGRGELLTALAELPSQPGSGDPRLRLFGVDLVPRPPRLPPEVGWAAGLTSSTGPDAAGTDRIGSDGSGLLDDAFQNALVIGWELLDVVPCPILELDDAGRPRVLLVEPATGRERLGAPAGPADLAWCQRWWPFTENAEEGDRLEVGRPRDEFWANLVRRAIAARAGALLAVDYAHHRTDRPPAGSLTGFRSGRAVPPRPDSSMDLTAHVAIDSVADAALAAGAWSATLTQQRTALRALGVTHPELLDPGSLGGFDWLLHQRG